MATSFASICYAQSALTHNIEQTAMVDVE